MSPEGAVWSLISVLKWCHSSQRQLKTSSLKMKKNVSRSLQLLISAPGYIRRYEHNTLQSHTTVRGRVALWVLKAPGFDKEEESVEWNRWYCFFFLKTVHRESDSVTGVLNLWSTLKNDFIFVFVSYKLPSCAHLPPSLSSPSLSHSGFSLRDHRPSLSPSFAC